MNTTPFLKLAYAITWISNFEFTILERTGFENISMGGPYVHVADMPSWETPESTIFKAGSSWFVLAQDPREGLEMVKRHVKRGIPIKNPADEAATYVVLTLQQVILCKADGNGLVWTQSETLFDGNTLSDKGVDMILWAIHTTCASPEPSMLNNLPVEIQDRILFNASTSVVASAKLGCELGIGSSFSWTDHGGKIRVEEAKRHRFESSPVESQIVLNGVLSGLSYKREFGYKPVHNKRATVPVLVRS